MTCVKRIVCVSDTDCTKALYFTSMLKFVQEGFEEVMRTEFKRICSLFSEGKIALPIVSVEGSFLAPIYAGNVLDIQIELELFNTSFCVVGEIFHDGILKGSAKIKHVCINTNLQKGMLSKELFRAPLVS